MLQVRDWLGYNDLQTTQRYAYRAPSVDQRITAVVEGLYGSCQADPTKKATAKVADVA